MTDVTVITPIAPHHQELFPRCRASVEQQTVAVRHLHMVDHKKRGPGYIRNQLLKQVETEYVVFLDADDYLEPTFVEECLDVVEPHGYVYTNWWEGDTEKEMTDGEGWDKSWHLVTCLIHTDMVRIAGGFDETMIAMEDTDLFLKFDGYAYCGIKVDKSLVNYTNDGKRSKDARNDKLIPGIKRQLSGKYINMGCCSDKNNPTGARPAVGQKAPGDVQVMALWQGNQVTGGAVTGRRYQRASRPMRLWVDPRDAKAAPHLYRVIPPKKKKSKKKPPTLPKPTPEQRGGAMTFGDMLVRAGVAELPKEAPLPVMPAILSPNFNKVNEIAQRIYS